MKAEGGEDEDDDEAEDEVYVPSDEESEESSEEESEESNWSDEEGSSGKLSNETSIVRFNKAICIFWSIDYHPSFLVGWVEGGWKQKLINSTGRPYLVVESSGCFIAWHHCHS